MTADDPIRARLYQITNVNSGAPDFMLTMGINYGQMCKALGAVLDLHPLTPHAPCEIEYGGQGGFWKDGTMRCRERVAIATSLGVET